ncbi:flavodoxin [bacterium]|nr:flavodoxin [bacterium]
MITIGLFYGSTTGNTEESAMAIAQALRTVQGVAVDIHEISTKTVGAIVNYDRLIFGVPTWDVGELQSDWDMVLLKLQSLNFTGKMLALFGHGDSIGYPDTYQDAIGILGTACLEQGADLVGWWAADGYKFDESQALMEGMFMGLALDDNETEKAADRIQAWVEQLIVEFALLTLEDA